MTMSVIDVYRRTLEEEATTVSHLYKALASLYGESKSLRQERMRPMLDHLSRAESALQLAVGLWPEELS